MTPEEIRATLPAYNELMYPTIEVLRALGRSATTQEINAAVVEKLGLSEEQQSLQRDRDNYTVLAERLSWARTYLKKVGVLDRSARAVWVLTERGEKITPAEVARVPSEVQALERERKKQTSTPTDESEVNPEAAQADPGEEGDEDWIPKVITALLALTPDQFERLITRLLRETGCDSVRVMGRANASDGGIDGVGILRLSLVSFPVYFQAKRHSNTVGASTVRDFRGAMSGRGDRGVIVSTATYTSAAKLEATRDGAPPIDLIDGLELANLLKTYGLGVQVEMVEQVVVDADYFRSI